MTDVARFLQSEHLTFQVIPHARACTSIEEALTLGIAVDDILKTVMVKTAGGYAAVIVPASRRLDLALVRAAMKDHQARLATEEELLRDFPDYELGSLPPIGSLLGAPAFVDMAVMVHEVVAFAAGSETRSVRMSRRDLFDAQAVTMVPLTRPDEERGTTANWSLAS